MTVLSVVKYDTELKRSYLTAMKYISNETIGKWADHEEINTSMRLHFSHVYLQPSGWWTCCETFDRKEKHLSSGLEVSRRKKKKTCVAACSFPGSNLSWSSGSSMMRQKSV